MNDLERATKSAYGMIAYAGMSDKLPNICYYNNDEYNFQKPYSDTTAKTIDEEVLKMINGQYERAKQILTEHKEGHNRLAQILIEREVIMAEDVEEIFGKRPWVSRTQELLEQEEKSQPKLEDMPEEVKQAQAEHEARIARVFSLQLVTSQPTFTQWVSGFRKVSVLSSRLLSLLRSLMQRYSSHMMRRTSMA